MQTVEPSYVYILRCSDGPFYIGHTDDLERRIALHEAGEIPGYTVRRRPVALEYSCEFATRIEALGRERQLKGWSRARKQALFAGDFGRLRALSRPSTTGSQSEPSAQDERKQEPAPRHQ